MPNKNRRPAFIKKKMGFLFRHPIQDGRVAEKWGGGRVSACIPSQPPVYSISWGRGFCRAMALGDIPTIPAPRRFLGCNLHPVTVPAFIRIVTDLAASGTRCKITYLNAHCSNLSASHAAYRVALKSCSLVYADGKGVVWAARFLGQPVPERVNAGDFIEDFLRACAGKGLSIFLLGCADGIAQRAAAHWQARVPGLEIAGTHHGYFGGGDEETVAAAINASEPDIVLVGMSAPVQELWMERWAPRLDAPVVWCVGALFEYFSGVRRRAPRWVRRIGMEWLFRLVLEPGRLWKRYLVGNAVFAARVLKARFFA